MYTYTATNYGMGRAHGTRTFQAYSDAEARTTAERLLPGKHGTIEQGRKGRILGIRKHPGKVG